MPAGKFLSEEDEQKLVDAITAAEHGTSGEIRIHIEFKCKKNPLDRAEQLFHRLKMDQTEYRNGVLIYIATEDRKVAIYGGQGISGQVDDHFWQEEIDKLIAEFKQGRFEEGLEEVVADVGDKLKRSYPSRGDDPNELDNEISFEDNRDD